MRLSATFYYILASCLFHALLVNCKGGKLINIFYDGFSTEYLNEYYHELPGLQLMYTLGVRARYLVPVFPSKTWVNFYAQSTGRYAESHGITGNFLYDPKRDEHFRNGTNTDSKNSHWWDEAEPYWITTVRQGKRSYMYYYLVCEAVIKGLKPTKCVKWDPMFVGSEYFEQALYDGLEDLITDRADVVGVYFQMIDSFGHMFGPGDARVKDMVMKVDRILFDFFSYMIKRGYGDTVDIMMFSDHGMTPVSQSRKVNITGAFDKQDVITMLDSGPVIYIWPKEGRLEKIYRQLKYFHPKMKVYRKEETPAHWHFRQNQRIPPLLLVAEPMWYITTPFRGFRNYGTYPRKGEHGFEILHHQSRGIFVAKGPHFKKNFIANPVSNVDIYQLICAILDLEPQPNNGTWSNVDYFYRDHHISAGSTSTTRAVILAIWELGMLIAACVYSTSFIGRIEL